MKFGIPPTILHVNYRVREPHVSHTGINVYAYCPLHLPKKVSKKPSVNHIGSSTNHQQENLNCCQTSKLDSSKCWSFYFGSLSKVQEIQTGRKYYFRYDFFPASWLEPISINPPGMKSVPIETIASLTDSYLKVCLHFPKPDSPRQSLILCQW